jgi:HD superfamily phosphohydrolase
MKYKDKIYGKCKIEEKIILDIIREPIFERLKGIDQAGYFEVYFPGTKHSRFEHSVGCYLLLKRYNASLKEQIAGLIHDVSHSAFSHTADYVFAQGRGADHNYQDDIFVDFVYKTNIVRILEEYGYNVDEILNEDNFPLQETQLPNLCADRIDYSLRGMTVYNIADKGTIENILKSLRVIDNEWVFDNFDIALQYAQLFKKLNDIYYSNKETAAMFLRTSKWIKYAIQKEYISHRDLFTTDEEVIKKINIYLNEDVKLQELWNEMNNSQIECGKNDKEGEKVIVKSRVVDPLVIINGNIKHISILDKDWFKSVQEDKVPKTYYIR